ncbi:MAG: fumarylacetoacetate hydrolase family protein [Acidimicrobiia bacterium]|nr:fumarylacetoacetate hydrolase family protein [Acidimicrobiia bacterium]MDH3399209.1 fumarylacetoacetate hydrolase family protein [Acidimicrobiia bacterium]
MRLVTIEDQNGRRVGVMDGDAVADVTAVDRGLPADMIDLIGLGSSGLDRLRGAFDGAPRCEPSSFRLLAPIPRPRKNVMAVGRNYRDHAKEFSESGFDASEKQMIPDHPVVFTKAPTSVIGPGVPIDTSNDPLGTPDYEGELAFVVGMRAKSVPRERAMQHVYGYTIINDVTARDLQKRHVQWFMGKSPDTFCPMGPCITTVDELPDIGESWMRTWVNGELRQEAPISALIFDVPTLIAVLSEVMTLEPGDVVATGTGLGVGIGFDPPRYLQPGDQVEIAIDGIGRLSNPVI